MHEMVNVKSLRYCYLFSEAINSWDCTQLRTKPSEPHIHVYLWNDTDMNFMSLVNAECNTQLRPLIQIGYHSSTTIKALNSNMNVDRTDLLQLNKELDKHTRNSIVHGCPKSRPGIWFCVAHNSILTFYNAVGVTALIFFTKSYFFKDKPLWITHS
jgi:hypothetical protein